MPTVRLETVENWAFDVAWSVAPPENGDQRLCVAIAMAVYCRLMGWDALALHYLAGVRDLVPQLPSTEMTEFLAGTATWNRHRERTQKRRQGAPG